MVKNQRQFSERLQRLSRKHDAMTRGYVTHMQPDGLIVARPKRPPIRISGRAVLLCFAAFIGFKVFLVASLGLVTYEERLGRLQAGTMVERIGAFAMQVDPVTKALAKKVVYTLR